VTKNCTVNSFKLQKKKPHDYNIPYCRVKTENVSHSQILRQIILWWGPAYEIQNKGVPMLPDV